MKKYPTAEQVKTARVAAGMTQQACADRFDYLLRSWQKKEQDGANGRLLSPGEFELLLLLAGQHPDFSLVAK
jgi:hypothetical protein